MIPPKNINDLKEGDEVILKCSVKQHNPPAYRFAWYKNGKKLQEASETFKDRKATAPVQKYKCEADNGISTGTSEELTVNLKCKYYII